MIESRYFFISLSLRVIFCSASTSKNKRKFLPGNVMYGPLGHMLARMDGKKNLAQIILEVEAEQKITLSDK